MSKLNVVKYGNPVLRTPAKRVLKVSAKIQKLVFDMMETMYANNGCGLAAPQVGESLSIFVLDCSSESKKYPAMVFINPKIVKSKGACKSHEGCLSFPEVFVDVKRHAELTIRYQDLKGRQQEMSVNVKDDPLLCRAIQHEMDHLNGILFIDYVIDYYGTDEILRQKGLPPIEKAKQQDTADLDALLDFTTAETIK
ncbi:MAG: peptide deformylase [Vampirovibrionales bacterium]|jgi:peptide deformylase